jgi:DNA-binding NtrC family response regulator
VADGGGRPGAVEWLRMVLYLRETLERALVEAVEACADAGVDRAEVAELLGVHRSTLYRRYLGGQS